mmetsp:Transcript_28628/g.51774  ORF Transcript_28628/g.51774 Transcript_28628/m.51774 type:complete len:85 (-) Transcript_28628:188-442(-)|eukprot:CAMPEP_0201888584 /NCGR_PEP_ID=MMETSP0902-20130614/27989_1 /ASSEMBLY_ACC=CAM_ASM_000551 /TAXON_ID=420261 /ORGANISM="Thalassiosira antarctica, Strain CCMP982" /LENGTH=84 /DNA_ID=CAMNT_0048418877 /DNA_START=350 /DNA_END=604 /DNA_ORIENTATION=-
MPDSNKPVADIESREPSTIARAARTGGGVALMTLDLEGMEVAFWDADIGGSGSIIFPKLEFPLPPKTPLFNADFEDVDHGGAEE